MRAIFDSSTVIRLEKNANLWGWYDMHVNAWEIVLDGYGPYDPLGIETGTEPYRAGWQLWLTAPQSALDQTRPRSVG